MQCFKNNFAIFLHKPISSTYTETSKSSAYFYTFFYMLFSLFTTIIRYTALGGPYNPRFYNYSPIYTNVSKVTSSLKKYFGYNYHNSVIPTVH